MVELWMVALSVPAGLLGWGLGVLLRRHCEVGDHECGESVESVCDRVSGARRGFVGPHFVSTHPSWYS